MLDCFLNTNETALASSAPELPFDLEQWFWGGDFTWRAVDGSTCVL